MTDGPAPLHLRLAPTAEGPRGVLAAEAWSAEIGGRFERLLARLGGDWKRLDGEGWGAESVSPEVQRVLWLTTAGPGEAFLTARATARLPRADALSKAALVACLPSAFLGLYFAHDVWRLSVVPTAMLVVPAALAPFVLWMRVERALTRAASAARSLAFLAEVKAAIADPALGLWALPPADQSTLRP